LTHKNQTTGGITDALNQPLFFKEHPEDQIIFCTTSKRKQKIKIFVPVGNFARWKILYEDGREITKLSDGYYLSRREAIKAVVEWERTAKKTQDAKQFELFGDKTPPVLKRKKIRNGPRAETNSG